MNNNYSGIVPSLESINYGKQKKDGGHDHRFNTGNDRTPKQKDADKNKRNRG